MKDKGTDSIELRNYVFSDKITQNKIANIFDIILKNEVNLKTIPDLITIEMEINGLASEFTFTKEGTPKEKQSGVYLYIVIEDYEFDYNEEFKNFFYVSSINKKDPKKIFCSPLIKIPYKENKIILKKGTIFYAGQSKEMGKRKKQHENECINMTNSLKLGLRKNLSNKLVYYWCEIIEINDKKILESFFHDSEHHSFFGK